MPPVYVGDSFEVLLAHRPRLYPAADKREIFVAYLHTAMQAERYRRIWAAEAADRKRVRAASV